MSENTLPPLNWLRAFEASARHLSFTAAASELNMTQSAVSQQMRSLEQFLGRALFIRRTRAIQLTDAGLSYLPVVQEAFETLSAGTRMMTGGDRGRVLMVQCNLAFSVFWLAPRLKRLLARHPWISLNTVTHTWDPNRSPSDTDVEIMFGRLLDERVGGLRLGDNQSFPVATPQFADSLGDTPTDWREAHLFDCTGVLANFEAWAKARGERLPKGKIVNLSSTYSVSLNAALGGAGLAMGHDVLVADLLASGALVRPYEEAIPMEEAYYFRDAADHAQTPATRAFSEWLKEEMELE